MEKITFEIEVEDVEKEALQFVSEKRKQTVEEFLIERIKPVISSVKEFYVKVIKKE